MRSSDFRAKARGDLKNNYFYALVVCVLASIILNFGSMMTGSNLSSGVVSSTVMNGGYSLAKMFGFSACSGILSVAAFLFAGAINTGRANYFLHLADGRTASVEDLFAHFKNFGNTLVMHIITTLWVMLWCLPAVVLFFITLVIAAVSGLHVSFSSAAGFESFFESSSAPAIVAVCVVLIMAAAVCSYIANLTCMLAPYILSEHPEISGIDAVKMSRSMMRGNKWRMFKLHLSFAGWYALGLLCFGVGVIFTPPYVEAAKAEFFNEISGKNIERAKRAEEYRNSQAYGQPNAENPYSNMPGRDGCSFYHSSTRDCGNYSQNYGGSGQHYQNNAQNYYPPQNNPQPQADTQNPAPTDDGDGNSAENN